MSDSRERILVIYEKMVASQPRIQRKGAANPYTSMNGSMFSFITKEDQIALASRAMLSKPAQLAKLFAQSVAYAETLPAKPTTKKAAKKKVAKKTPTRRTR
jgi:hypothetical protein